MDLQTGLSSFFNERFGMFVHWGLFSVAAGIWKGRQQAQDELGEGIIQSFHIPIAEYKELAAQFNPSLSYAENLVRTAKETGMRYLVITAKHADGFCLFRSAVNTYNAYDSIGRDLVLELARACRKYGLKLGLYYNHTLDYSEPDALGTLSVSGRRQEIPYANTWDFPDEEQKDFSRFLYGKVFPQVKELLTQYGDILLMWFDFPHNISQDQCRELYALVKSLQPDCLVNSRIGNIISDYYDLGDNQIPTIPMDVAQECLVTLNDTWGYKATDHNWKQPEQIIDMLARTASCGANLLLNVGPKSDGSLTAETEDILSQVSAWVARNKAALYGTRRSPFSTTFDWGHVAQKGNKLFLYMKDAEERSVELNGLDSEIVRVSAVGAELEVPFSQISVSGQYKRLTIKIPRAREAKPVYCLESQTAIHIDGRIMQQGGSLRLHPIWAVKATSISDGESIAGIDKEINVFEIQNGMRGLAVNRIAVAAGWRDSREHLRWEAFFTQPGSYQIQLITQPGEHIGDERCGVAVTVEDPSGNRTSARKQQLTEDFQFQVSKTGRENSRIGSLCGSVQILSPGLHRIRLSRLKSGDNNLPVVWLQFAREKD